MEKKKILLPTVIAVVTLIALVVGATYAYFSVATTNNFGTRTVTASAADVGSVALVAGSNLSMSLTAADMMNKGSETTTLTTANIATASVTGAGTFTCNYTLTVDDNTSSMYDAFQNMSTKSAGQIVLSVNGTAYDFNTSSLFPKTISGTMAGLTASVSKNITAQLKVVNKTSIDQSDLAGTSITLTFKVTAFSCTATA